MASSTWGLSVMTNYTSAEDEAFFGAIGRLAISWAQIELGLDCAIDIIHRFLGGQKIQQIPPKTSLFRKLQYIREWTPNVPEPTFCTSARKLLDQIEAASETRHDIIHGIIIEHVEGSGEAQMVRLIHNTQPISKKRFAVTTNQILQAAVDASELGRRSLTLGTGLQDLVPVLAEIAKQSTSKVGS
jgi:hypothetical protein